MTAFNLNKTANLEIEHDLIKYRIPLIEFSTDNIIEIEKDIKRKVKEIENEGYYLTPFKVEIINSYVIYYYDVKNMKSFLYLRQLDFKEKLKYFTSLITIAKNSRHTKTTWSKYNFIVDPFEEKIKAITYETNFVKMSEQTDEVEGIKKLILISLTDLNDIISKPRKVNFIGQDPDIINFAETILLKIENLEDLESYIETLIIEYEYGEKKPSNIKTENDIAPKKKVLSFNIKKDKKKNTPTPIKNKKKNSKFTLKEIIIGSVFGVAILIGVMLNLSQDTSDENIDNKKPVVASNLERDNTKDNTNGNSPNIEDIQPSENDSTILTAYRLSLSNNNDEAIALLESIGYDNLNDYDKSIMLSIYVKAGHLVEVIELQPESAEKIVNDLIADDNKDKLLEIYENLSVENPYVTFEVAYIQGNWEKVIEIKDQVRMNGRKETQITEAYIHLQKFDEAKVFAEEVGNPDLIRMVETRM